MAIMLTIQTGETELPDALPGLLWWHWLILGLLALTLLAAVIWALVAWRRRRLAAAPARRVGPSLATHLPRLWRPFYRMMPARARHFPTVVVMGAAGVGKSHAIASHVDWRGQSNQFRRSALHDAALQLYLGPQVVVHELSAPLLRDVGPGARLALWRMWRRMGPSATVVLVLDARTLLATPPAALRELAQLVRGKIDLFPRRCRESLEVRVLLSHVDQVDGFEVFAAVVGPDHEPIDLESLGPGTRDAAALVATFDAHLAYALTSRDGEAFDRLVSFYSSLEALLTGLWPLLTALRSEDDPHAAPLRPGGLYLSSLAPRSHVGKPFKISAERISASLASHRWRGLRGSLAVAVCGVAAVTGLTVWHSERIREAERLMVDFQAGLPEDGTDCAMLTPTERQMRASIAESDAIQAFKTSEVLWLTGAYVARKQAIRERFEVAIRSAYLYPKIGCYRDRRKLHYVMSLIYSSRDNELGQIIRDNLTLWSKELGLPETVINHYIEASDPDMSDVAPQEPAWLATLEGLGRDWSRYLEDLEAKLGRATISAAEAEALVRELPPLLSMREYTALMAVQTAFKRAGWLRGRFEQLLVIEPFDLWTEEQFATLRALREVLADHLPYVTSGTHPDDTIGWGIVDVVKAVQSKPPAILGDFAISVHARSLALPGSALTGLIERSRAHILVAHVLPRVTAGREHGAAFFRATDRPARAGDVAGYGGRATGSIAGLYTREGYSQRVEPVLRFASGHLGPALGATGDGALTKLGLAPDDARRLDAEIRAHTKRYAVAYQHALLDYYASMELDHATEFTLPIALQAFTQSSSWFIDYLRAVADNAALELPADDPYAEPLANALETFKPLVDLLESKDGTVPGLDPYRKILAGLEPALGGAPESRDGAELHHRLTPLGILTLKELQDPGKGLEGQVEQWLAGAGLDDRWHAPFLAPVEEARRLGVAVVELEVRRAWVDEVRPIVGPLLAGYPFAPAAAVDVDPDEMEALVRAQGKEPGAFWAAFARLIGPATARVAGVRVMLPGLDEPAGMLTLTGDLERTSRILWDADGQRVPLKVVLAPLVLPKEPHEDRYPAMVHLRSGGAAVYGFNQRQDPQTLELQWWNQGISVVSLEMRPQVTSLGKRTTSLEEDGSFSFYRLLDRAENERRPGRRPSLTAAAIEASTRCPPGLAVGSKPLTAVWSVPVGDALLATRAVRMILRSDPWLAFSVRSCG